VLSLVVRFVTCTRLHLFYPVSKICTFINKKYEWVERKCLYINNSYCSPNSVWWDFTVIPLSSLLGITLNIQFQSIELLTSSSGWSTNCSTVRAVEQKRNVMAHAQKPELVFLRNGRVHLNRRGGSVQSTTGSRGVEETSGYPLHSPLSPSLPLPCVTVCHHVSFLLYLTIIQRKGLGQSTVKT
jgi:hypothetical protein